MAKRGTKRHSDQRLGGLLAGKAEGAMVQGPGAPFFQEKPKTSFYMHAPDFTGHKVKPFSSAVLRSPPLLASPSH